MAKRSNLSAAVAFGGVTAAVAVVIMCMGGLIPVATFICPVLCTVLTAMNLRAFGKRMAWAWYGAAAFLSLLLSPDKEAAAIFLFLGYYPIIKGYLERLKWPVVWKLLYFNAVVAVVYGLFIRLLGLEYVLQEYVVLGTVMTVIMLMMGNVTFYLLDQLLDMQLHKRKRRK